ncbi:hypothetical protein NLI96_g6094 [Meripilus lineatus]|uniref:F-box domain-containing protein n=1 Tax=Meripilus lineatus TaxID=2056292 RepID=A0AAD5V2B6_9APHY|nr:hypothetical protein NLI96_g6094 [Physisporinus lineatus]
MDLPIELINHIFTSISSESDLSSCSLVCSSWTDTAHRHLFRKLVYIREGWGRPEYPALLLFLQDTPYIAKHVRMLDLVGGGHINGAILESHVFSGLLRTLPNLQHVKIHSIWLSYTTQHETKDKDGRRDRFKKDGIDDVWNWDEVIDEKSPTIAGSGRRLESLKIQSTRIQGGNPCITLFQFLQVIGTLHTLQISYITSRAHKKSVAFLRDYCSSLAFPSHLGIQNYLCHFWGFDRYFVGVVVSETLRRAPPCTLRHLDFTLVDRRSATSYVGAFLKDIGAGLETLSISLRGEQSEWTGGTLPVISTIDSSYSIQDNSLDLSSCKSLRSLTFNHSLAIQSNNLVFCTNAMLDALVTTPRIPFKLSIKLGDFIDGAPWTATYPRFLSDLNWKKLVEVVRSHPCKEKKVAIIWAGSRSFSVPNDIEQVIREKLADPDVEGWMEVVRECSG